ncbi:MAG: hypothetical protein OXM01_08815 [Gemmatimonadota bacterium]|nr:hypothetical protein [Gemmatimonadota bacterium]
MTGANYAIAVVMGICCFLAVAGAPLPWMVVNTGLGTVSVSGLSGEMDSLGVLTLIPALLVTALFVLTLITKRWHLLVKIGLILSSSIVAVVGIFFVSVVISEAGIGMGLWMTTWGGVGMVVASIWGSVKWNSSIQH